MLIASIVTIFFIFVMLIYLFSRIMKKDVVSATQHLEVLERDYTKKEVEINKKLQEAGDEAKRIIAKAREDADLKKEEILKKAAEEKDVIIKDARTQSDDIIKQAEKSKHLLISEVEQRIEKQATEKACELIEEVLPGQFKYEVHTQWVDDLIKEGFADIDKLHVGESVQEAKIISALPLEEHQHELLIKKLKQIAKRDVSVKEEIDPKVVAGLIINIGNLVLDGSLRFKIKEKIKNA